MFLNTEKTMVAKVISEVKPNLNLFCFSETGPEGGLSKILNSRNRLSSVITLATIVFMLKCISRLQVFPETAPGV